MEPPNYVVMMVVGVHVEPVPLDKNVAVDNVFAFPTVLAVFVEMTDVGDLHAEPVRLPKLALMVLVLELPHLTVQEDLVDLIVPVVIAVSAHQAKDAVQEHVNATMIVTKEIVGMLPNLREPTSACALKDHVEHVPQASLVEAMDDARPQHLVMSSSLLLIAELELP